MPEYELFLPQIATSAGFVALFLLLSAAWRYLLKKAGGKIGQSSENGFWAAVSLPGYMLSFTAPLYFYCMYMDFPNLKPEIFLASRLLLNGSLILLVGEIIFAAGLKYYSSNTPGKEFPSIFRQLIKALVYVILFLSFMSNIYKIDITPLLTTSAVFTMILGLALQDVLGNFFAGLSVHISPPFKIGDWIQLHEYYGKVLESNWRATTLRLATSAIVCIPNNQISKNEITNFSDGTGSQFKEFTIGLSYEVSPERIRRLLIGAAQQVEEIFTRPTPVVVLKEFDAYTINYKIRFWMDNEENPDRVCAHLASRIWYRLKRDGLSIPFPISDVYIHQEKDNRQKVIEHRLALISGIDFLANLEFELKSFIAERLEECWYETGEEIVTEGAFDTDFFVIDRGRVSVKIASAGNRPVADLHEGDFFGEMSLLTGEKRSASVLAKCECRLLKLNRDSMGRLLSENKQLAEKLSHTLAERSNKNAALKEIEDKNTGRKKGSHDENIARAAILRRICSFFKL